jgi:hypothetical protein
LSLNVNKIESWSEFADTFLVRPLVKKKRGKRAAIPLSKFLTAEQPNLTLPQNSLVQIKLAQA